MQGFNMGRYVPPDVEGVISGNSLHKRRPPGVSSSGQQTIRFEMPFAVWCSTCPKPTLIPQGVRFNATKKRAGNYYTTPVWEFGMRHADCGGALRIVTDPKNTDYRVVEGGKRRDYGDDGDDGHPSLRGEEQEGKDDGRQSAFSRLEKTIEDRAMLARASERIESLEDDRKKGWTDPYTMNQALRNHFRVGRRERERAEREGERLRDRLGGIGEELQILGETEEDRRRAALVEFGRRDGGAGADGMERGLFEKGDDGNRHVQESAGTGEPKMTKAAALAKRTLDGLAAKVRTSVRRTQDPFLVPAALDKTVKQPALLCLKRKRDEDPGGGVKSGHGLRASATSKERKMEHVRRGRDDKVEPPGPDTAAGAETGSRTVSTPSQAAPATLVDYDSDESE